jgi:selenocysteine lyase/cysteine desulfurase
LKLQQILGIYIPPVTKERLYKSIEKSNCADDGLLEEIEKNKPVIFVSAYEHHSNELMWRESFAEVVVIGLDENGLINLKDLEQNLSADRCKNRLKLASFSAGSNITGLKTDVYEVARICHRHEVPVLFDFAAIAPYVKIDMNHDAEAYFDAIFFSPHKFIGGPSTSGVLIFNQNLYQGDLPPTTAGGGTVDYVGYQFHDFMKDIESREKAGTPPILQTIKTALVMELKEKIGCDVIEEQEHRFSQRFFDRIKKIENIELIGNIPPDKRVPIISFCRAQVRSNCVSI